MVKQFSLAKLMLALAIIGQFSAAFAWWNPFSPKKDNFNQDFENWLNRPGTIECKESSICLRGLLVHVFAEKDKKFLPLFRKKRIQGYRKEKIGREAGMFKGTKGVSFYCSKQCSAGALAAKVYGEMPIPNEAEQYRTILKYISKGLRRNANSK